MHLQLWRLKPSPPCPKYRLKNKFLHCLPGRRLSLTCLPVEVDLGGNRLDVTPTKLSALPSKMPDLNHPVCPCPPYHKFRNALLLPQRDHESTLPVMAWAGSYHPIVDTAAITSTRTPEIAPTSLICPPLPTLTPVHPIMSPQVYSVTSLQMFGPPITKLPKSLMERGWRNGMQIWMRYSSS